MDHLAKLDEEEQPGEPWEVRLATDWEAIEFAPIEGYRDNKEFMINLCKTGHGLCVEHAEDELKEDFDVMLEAVRHSWGEAMKFVGKDMHRNRQFMLGCVAVTAEVLKHCSNKCKNDEEAKVKSVKGVFYCYRRGGADGLPFKTGPCNPTNAKQCESCARIMDDPENCPLPQDRGFITSACELDSQALKFADKELQGEKDIVMAAVQSGGLSIQYASEEMQADRDVGLAATKQTWKVFKLLNKKLRADREIALAAVGQDWHALKFVAKELRKDEEIMMLAVKQSWIAFEHLVPEFRRKRAFAMEAVSQCWRAYQHMGTDLKADKEIAITAVCQHGPVLELAAESIQDDKEVVLHAIRQDWHALRFATPAVRADMEVLMAAVQSSGFALKFAVEDMKCHPELVAAAMTEQWPSLDVAVMPLFPAQDGLDPAFWNALTTHSGIKGKLKHAVPLGVGA